MIIKTKIILVCLLFSCISCSGNNETAKQHDSKQQAEIIPEADTGVLDFTMFYSTEEDELIFDDYISQIKESEHGQMADVIIKTARFFLGKPYTASTLEFEPEGLVINLREFDCTTFVESVLALSITVEKYDYPTFDDFCTQLQYIRYRKGTINDYTSRLHYFSDWIYENETFGFVKDITKEVGGEPYKPELSFISSHPDSYKQLKSNPEYAEIIQRKEQEISKRDIYTFIPEAKINSCKKEIKDGDIICFVTDIKGLDVSHVGFAYHNSGELTFIHASTSAKKVIINPQPLLSYVKNNRRNTGIIVVRPTGIN